MKLYKYLRAGGPNPLASRLIRFTQAACLNDPFEMRPRIGCLRTDEALQDDITAIQSELNMSEIEDETIAEVIGSLNRKERRALRRKDVKTWLQVEKRRTGRTDEQMLTEMRADLTTAFHAASPALLETAQRAVRENFGVLCLTDQPDNVLMWSHYADNLNGFLIEFDPQHPFFNPTEDKVSGVTGIRRVLYADEPPLIEQFIDERNSIDSLFFVKGRKWEYESEWRMARPLKGATRIVATDNGPAHLFDLPLDAVTGIVIGERVSQTVRDELRTAVATNLAHEVTVRTAHAASTSYSIELHLTV